MSVSIDLVGEIARNHFQHCRTTQWWVDSNEKFTSTVTQELADLMGVFELGSAGEVSIRNVNFGSITSAHLFGLDELIIFAWYEMNSSRYKKTLDLGANIGVHSMLMSKFGSRVTAYEPDPVHVELFYQTMKDNAVESFELRQKAIGINFEKLNFTRVLGNTTGSHLSGAKARPYGELEVFEVAVDSIRDVVREKYDFIKMDVEGYEVKLISALESEDFNSMEIMLEIGTSENAFEMFTELKRLGIRAFSQKTNWSEVEKIEDLPTSYREGSLFLTACAEMNWECR